MNSLSVMESNMPPGFRFHPMDDELICDYLSVTFCGVAGGGGGGGARGIHGRPAIITVDLNKCEPWELPEVACVGGKEWYFFSLRDRKYATGHRTNRATISGYWKATGKDRPVTRNGSLVGMRKTLVFYQGRAPKGKKTEWVMHEFRMEPPQNPCSKGDWVLCRVFYKSRGISSGKAGKNNTAGETSSDDTGYSLLPPLSDAFISFDHHQQQNHHQAPAAVNGCEGFEQVPCFSNIHQQFNCLINNNNNQTLLPHTVSAAVSGCGLPPAIQSYLSTLSSDRKALGAMLGNLAKLESGSKMYELPMNVEPLSPESLLSRSGTLPPWNSF